jgi:hypothetical protein
MRAFLGKTMIDRECRIRIDKDGNWFYNQSPITNRNVRLYLTRHISKDERGNYRLQTATQTLPVEVEDTPFIVKHCFIINDIPLKVKVILDDETAEILAWTQIWQGDERHIYCAVKQGAFTARFNRDSQFELGDRLQLDEGRMRYYVTLRGEKFYLAVSQGISQTESECAKDALEIRR